MGQKATTTPTDSINYSMARLLFARQRERVSHQIRHSSLISSSHYKSGERRSYTIVLHFPCQGNDGLTNFITIFTLESPRALRTEDRTRSARVQLILNDFYFGVGGLLLHTAHVMFISSCYTSMLLLLNPCHQIYLFSPPIEVNLRFK